MDAPVLRQASYVRHDQARVNRHAVWRVRVEGKDGDVSAHLTGGTFAIMISSYPGINCAGRRLRVASREDVCVAAGQARCLKARRSRLHPAGRAEAGAKATSRANVQLSLLGPVRARRGPAELDVGPRQQRAILALLLVRANQLVTVDGMIALLWDQNPPGSAVNIIHKYIGCIRRLLEPDLQARASGRWLTRHGEAYRLAADEDMSDLIAFRRLVKAARSAHARGRPTAALDLLRQALACGGEPAARTCGSMAATGITSRR